MHPSKIILYTYIGLLLQGLLVAEQYAKYCRINADDVGQNLSTVPPNLVRIHPHTPSHIGCDSSVWLLERTTPRETAEIHLNPQIPFFSHNFWKQHQKRHVMWQFINDIYTYIDWSILILYSMYFFKTKKLHLQQASHRDLQNVCVCVCRRGAAQSRHHSEVPLMVNQILHQWMRNPWNYLLLEIDHPWTSMNILHDKQTTKSSMLVRLGCTFWK